MTEQDRVVREKPAPRKGPGNEILVVEDHAANILVVTTMLEYLGYTTDVATCGTAAIQKIMARTLPYTAILMDVQMRDMDGLETTRQIRALEKEKRFSHFIIGATAHALVSDRTRCIEAGMNDYISKPIPLDLLAQKLGYGDGRLWSARPPSSP